MVLSWLAFSTAVQVVMASQAMGSISHRSRIWKKIIKLTCDPRFTASIGYQEHPGQVKVGGMILTLSPTECRFIYKNMYASPISPTHLTMWEGSSTCIQISIIGIGGLGDSECSLAICIYQSFKPAAGSLVAEIALHKIWQWYEHHTIKKEMTNYWT